MPDLPSFTRLLSPAWNPPSPFLLHFILLAAVFRPYTAAVQRASARNVSRNMLETLHSTSRSPSPVLRGLCVPHRQG